MKTHLRLQAMCERVKLYVFACARMFVPVSACLRVPVCLADF